MGFLINEGVLEKYTEENGITEVMVPEGITKIASSAFLDCKTITSVVIPDGVQQLGVCVFRGCTSLRSVKFPKSVAFIGMMAFDETPWLEQNPDDYVIGGSVLILCKSKEKELFIPEGITYINEFAFENVEPEIIHLPDSLTELTDELFSKCSSIKKITMSDCVKVIPNSFLSECENLEEIQLPSELTEIGCDAFNSCAKLSKITFPETLTNIGEFAFAHCTALKDIRFPSSLVEIGTRAFEDCTGLKRLSLPDNHTELGMDAFGFISFDEVFIPAHFTDGNSITRAFFAENTGNIKIAPENDALTIVDGILFSKDIKVIYSVAVNKEQMEIPETVEEIADYAFLNCKKLAKITLPQSIRSIGKKAFQGCTALTEITIPETVSEIAVCTFNNCCGLKDVALPESLSSIGAYAFSNTAIQKIVIPQTVELLGEGAFEDCEHLAEVVMPDTIQTSQFYEDNDYEGDCWASYDVESKETLLKSAFCGTPWLKEQGYSADEEDG